jgi:hypothetical protein
VPKYLNISEDLQIVTGEGCRFLSRSEKELAVVESEVEHWVADNPTHPHVAEAEKWLNSTSDEIQRLLSAEDRRKMERAAIDLMENSIREYVRAVGRSKGWSKEKIREESKRKAGMAVKFFEME